MYNNKSFVAIIPARGGSKGIPKKNIINIGGKPLIQYTIEAAKNSKFIDNIIVSTDDIEIANISENCGVKIPYLRPQHLANDDTKTLDVVLYEIDKMKENEDVFDYVILLQPTSPLRNEIHIDEAIKFLIESNGNSLVSICETNENPVFVRTINENNKIDKLLKDVNSTIRRQELKKYYKVNGAIYINSLSDIGNNTSFNDNEIGYIMDKHTSIEIDEFDDLERLDKLINKKNINDKKCNAYIEICGRKIGEKYKPLVIAEIGINHGGSLKVAKEMVDAAYNAGAEVIKHQTHIVEDEMSKEAKKVIPGNTDISIYDVMEQSALDEKDELELKEYVESKEMIFLSTPFSRAAVDRLEKMGVKAYKIGSGEMNNYPLIEYVASLGKPIIMSTGMNDIESIQKAVNILERHKVQYALLHTTNLYPTPFNLVRLGAMEELKNNFPNSVIGLSDHTINNNACLAATALGASILERHFTDSKDRIGPDIICSMTPLELKELIEGTTEIQKMRGGKKEAAKEEKVTIDFAFATVVTIKDIKKGETLTRENIWVKRPGTGEIKAEFYEELLGKISSCDISADEHISWGMII